MTQEERDTRELLLTQVYVLFHAHEIELGLLRSQRSDSEKLADMLTLRNNVTSFYRRELLPVYERAVAMIHKSMGIC